MPHGATVRIGGFVVARQRPGTAKGVVFLLIEDETGHGERHRPAAGLRARSSDGADRAARARRGRRSSASPRREARSTSSSSASSRSTRPTSGPSVRPRPVKDFSPLDERERQRILEEQPLVAVGGGGADSAAPMPGTARTGALAAVASSGGDAGPTRSRRRRRANRCSVVRRRLDLRGGGSRRPGPWLRPQRPAEAPNAGRRRRGDLVARRRSPGVEDRPPDIRHPTSMPGHRDGEGSENPVREHGGSEDFRAVAPPVMSFAQGRRR